MMNILIIKEKLKGFYASYDYYIIPIIKFISALVAILIINDKIGYMTQLRTFPIIGLISIVSAILPVSLIVFIMSMLIVANIYALSIEASIIVLLIFVLMFLLYYKFSPKDGFLLILTVICFMTKIPFIVPLIVGILLTPVSAISVAFGTMIYYFTFYISRNAVTITNLDSENAIGKIKFIIDGIIMNKNMYIVILIFSVMIVLIYFIKRLSIDYSRIIALVTGSLVCIALFLLVNIITGIIAFTNINLVFGTVVSCALVALVDFFVFSVDYTRTERVQFEDDDYYYYVKAVPKVNVTVQKVNIKRINSKRTKNVNDKNKYN